MTCYITYDEEGEASVVSSNFDHDGSLCTSATKGSVPPIYCDKCKELLNYSLNE